MSLKEKKFLSFLNDNGLGTVAAEYKTFRQDVKNQILDAGNNTAKMLAVYATTKKNAIQKRVEDGIAKNEPLRKKVQALAKDIDKAEADLKNAEGNITAQEKLVSEGVVDAIPEVLQVKATDIKTPIEGKRKTTMTKLDRGHNPGLPDINLAKLKKHLQNLGVDRTELDNVTNILRKRLSTIPPLPQISPRPKGDPTTKQYKTDLQKHIQSLEDRQIVANQVQQEMEMFNVEFEKAIQRSIADIGNKFAHDRDILKKIQDIKDAEKEVQKSVSDFQKGLDKQQKDMQQQMQKAAIDNEPVMREKEELEEELRQMHDPDNNISDHQRETMRQQQQKFAIPGLRHNVPEITLRLDRSKKNDNYEKVRFVPLPVKGERLVQYIAKQMNITDPVLAREIAKRYNK